MSYFFYGLKIFVALLSFVSFALAPKSAHAQSIIRDTEVENIFHLWMAPLLEAADMGKGSVNLIVVNSPQVNAFVAGGANIFIYTGLIEKSESPGEVIGVLAHELGHIAGGHLIGGRDAIERASFESILGTVLGIGAAIATGNPQVASAIISGSSSLATSRFLAHSRVNESSADQAAVKFMSDARIDPEGLKSFLKKLESEELIPRENQSQYMRTHPVSADRVQALQAKIEHAHHETHNIPKLWDELHARMKAKLRGYIDPGRVVWLYNDTDQSIAAGYARAIAYYRQNEHDKGIAAIDALIKREPDNAYFRELRGDMLLSVGKIDDAIDDFSFAMNAAPKSSLIRVQLGKALLQKHQADEEQSLDQAIEVLKRALIDEPRSGQIYRLLATAYGRKGEEEIAKLHLAEEAILQRRIPYAVELLKDLDGKFPEGSHAFIKRADLLLFIHTNLKDEVAPKKKR